MQFQFNFNSSLTSHVSLINSEPQNRKVSRIHWISNRRIDSADEIRTRFLPQLLPLPFPLPIRFLLFRFELKLS